MTGSATLTRPADPAGDVDELPHIGCRRHSPDRAFCGAPTSGDWLPWEGQPACALCLLAVELSGRTPCDGCITDWRKGR